MGAIAGYEDEGFCACFCEGWCKTLGLVSSGGGRQLWKRNGWEREGEEYIATYSLAGAGDDKTFPAWERDGESGEMRGYSRRQEEEVGGKVGEGHLAL